MEDDKSFDAQQRHKVHRIFECLRDEDGFSGAPPARLSA